MTTRRFAPSAPTTRKWNHWMCARPSASVNGSARIATVSVSGVALTSSPLPLSNALLKWYDTLSLAVARRGASAVAAGVISAKRRGEARWKAPARVSTRKVRGGGSEAPWNTRYRVRGGSAGYGGKQTGQTHVTCAAM